MAIYIYILVTLLLSAFFSGLEIAYVSTDKLRRELDKNKGGASMRMLNILYAHPDRFITTMLLGNNVVLVVYGLLMAELLEPGLRYVFDNDTWVLVSQSLIGTVFILFMGEFIPKVTFRINPNQTIKTFAFPLTVVYIVLYPFMLFVTMLSRGVLFLFGQSQHKVDIAPMLTTVDLEHYLSGSYQEQGEVVELGTEVKIIQNAITFSSLQVRDCLIPRNEMVAVEIGEEVALLEEKFVRSGLSKLIVYRENIDDVVGYIHSSEMFKGPNWQERIVPAIFVPESMYASKLMKQLMQRKRSLAIVIDELGGTAGMVTLEDIVEEIFGDIEDEHDHQKRIARKVDDYTYILSGRMEIDDLNERFDLGLPEDEDFMTIAGFILYHHQSIPSQGEVIVIGSLRFEILRSTSTKIVLVKLRLPAEGIDTDEV